MGISGELLARLEICIFDLIILFHEEIKASFVFGVSFILWKKLKENFTKSKFISSIFTSAASVCHCAGENNIVLPSDSTILFRGSSLISMGDFFRALGSRFLFFSPSKVKFNFPFLIWSFFLFSDVFISVMYKFFRLCFCFIFFHFRVFF